MAVNTSVVIWEFLDSLNVVWTPFEPVQCVHIEKAHKRFLKLSGQQNSHLVDSSHKHIIDFNVMEEKNQSTDEVFPVRRLTFPQNSIVDMQVSWQWNATSNHRPLWQSYSSEVIFFIEEAYQKKRKKPLDLSKKILQFDYTIDFLKNLQVNNVSKFQRQIQRIILPDKYPLEHCPINLSSHSTTPAVVGNGTSSSFVAGTSSSSAPGTSSIVLSGAVDQADTSKSRGDGSAGVLPVSPSLAKYASAVQNASSDPCSICLVPLQETSAYSNDQQADLSHAPVVELKKCKHSFHTDCLEAAIMADAGKGSLTCPTCKTIYGVKTGMQPKGTMTHKVLSHPLPGYPGCGTIVITYNFRNGIQSADHPNPGHPYYAHSFPRTAYLPDNQEGKKILSLLRVAFDRRLTFTIGRSVTTGADNTITWNEIHHKTEMMSNISGHGYPDPNYFTNVTDELKQQGVTEDDLKH